MGVYGKVTGAKASGGGNYFEPGFDWVVWINMVKDIETRAKDHAFIVETKVLETSNERVRPGAERSFYCDMTKDAAPGNVKHFIETATEQLTGDPMENVPCDACDGKGKVGKVACPQCEGSGECSPIDEAGVLEIIGESQPFAGLILGLNTYNKDTRAGKPFTRHKWSTLSAVQLKKYEALAKSLGLGGQKAEEEEEEPAQRRSLARGK